MYYYYYYHLAGKFRRDGLAYLTPKAAGQWGRVLTRRFKLVGNQLLVDTKSVGDQSELKVGDQSLSESLTL